ncbi:MAG: glycoside hydrolase family 15 protein, partial [Sphingomonas oligoaromativorans]
MTTNLDLWPIGNCQVSGLVDRAGRLVWACLPRVDGEPVFSSLLSGTEAGDADAKGVWAIDL